LGGNKIFWNKAIKKPANGFSGVLYKISGCIPYFYRCGNDGVAVASVSGVGMICVVPMLKVNALKELH
jgi:hypothetical protein